MTGTGRGIVLGLAGLAVLTACARSENADTKVLRNDVDNVAAPPPGDSLMEDATPSAAGDVAIAAALRAEAEREGGFSDNPRWVVSRVDLDGDGSNEALAYVLDPMFCGSGGCTLYVLDENDTGWSVIDKIGPAHLPVYKLDPGPDGWAVLGVTIGGGGAQNAVMTVDHGEKGYSDNPTVAPAKVVTVSGREPVLAEDEGSPLPQLAAQ